MTVTPPASWLRRRLLRAGVAVPLATVVPRALAKAPATPSCGHSGPTRYMTAGPFYTPDTPTKSDFRADDPDGDPVNLVLDVVDDRCQPLTGVIVDLWHADSRGDYDNRGFRLRGHQRTDEVGVARFSTIRPARYGWRTPHYHARIFASDGRELLTTQLYFPGESANRKDGLFRPDLVMEVRGSALEREACFAFIVAG